MFDLDGTYGADVVLMRKLADLLKSHGVTLVMVTARNGTEDDRALVQHLGIEKQMPVLYAGSKPKRKVAREAGYEVDIWIEDNPIMVDFGIPGLALTGEHH